MGCINDLAAVMLKKMETEAAIKEAKINERIHARETTAKNRAQMNELKSRERVAKLSEKEQTKRVRSESRSAAIQNAVEVGANTVSDITQSSVNSLGEVLKTKDIRVKVPGVCDIKLDEKGEQYEDAQCIPVEDVSLLACQDDMTSNVFTNK